MAERPGTMIYFDIRPAVQRLDMEQRGKLFTAILDFAELGVFPDTLDPMTGIAFDLIRPRLERDAEKYEATCIHSRYMAYCRETKDNPKLSERDWRSLIATDSNRQLPTTTETATTTTEATATTTETAVSARRAAEKETGEGCKGEGEGETPLTDEEFEKRRQAQLDLLRRGRKDTP